MHKWDCFLLPHHPVLCAPSSCISRSCKPPFFPLDPGVYTQMAQTPSLAPTVSPVFRFLCNILRYLHIRSLPFVSPVEMYPGFPALGQLSDSDQLCVSQVTGVPGYVQLTSRHHSKPQTCAERSPGQSECAVVTSFWFQWMLLWRERVHWLLNLFSCNCKVGQNIHVPLSPSQWRLVFLSNNNTWKRNCIKKALM